MKRILLVDDSRLTLKIEEAHLRATGSYEVITATSGGEAVEKAIQSHPDVVLTDLNMPGLDGEALRRALAEDQRTSHIRVIVTTTAEASRRLDPGVECLLKPFDGPALREKLATSLQ